MKPNIATLRRLNILGNGNCLTDQAIFSATLKKWRQRLAYCSVFAAIPAVLASQIPVAGSDDQKRPEPKLVGEGLRSRERLNLISSSQTLLKRQSEFRLPHQKGSFAMLTAVAGLDDCPGRTIPGGNYTAAEPYVDSGDTTGANNTINKLSAFYYYNYDAFGPDHVYSFTLTARGPNPQIVVSTISSTYRPMIYITYGGFGACPAGTGATASIWYGPSQASTGGGSATLPMDYVPLGTRLHLFVDSRLDDSAGTGPYTIRMQDLTVAGATCPVLIDCPEFFVFQHYIDFLNREPDPPGFAAWLALLNNCLPGDTSCDRIHISSAFLQSPEFQGRGYFVYRFYNVAYGRKPDHDEFRSNLGYVSGFLTDAELEARKISFMADFMGRPAFRAKFNALTNTQYVDTLLATAGITHPARDLWIAALNNHSRARYEVLREIVESTEVYNKYYNQAFVVMQYFGYLRRDPDALYTNWIQELETTGDARNMINGFVNSVEYRSRFGP